MPLAYHINPQLYTLQRFKKDLLGRELIPSRRPLLEGLEGKITLLEKAGIHNLQELIDCLKNKRKMDQLSLQSGIGLPYLNLLRREVNSYFPRPVSLDSFPGIDPGQVVILAKLGLKNSRQYFEWVESAGDLSMLSTRVGIAEEALRELKALSDLSRAYGVGPVFARMLYAAGIHSLRQFRELSPQEVIDLYERQTGKKADFSVSDLSFSLALVSILDDEG